jgi:sulfur carrier protein ThiS adenylyltransferase
VAGSDLAEMTVKKLGNIYIVGDFKSDVANHKLYAHKVQTAAAMMTELIIRRTACTA